MKCKKQLLAGIVALVAAVSAPVQAYADTGNSITVNPEKTVCEISPYIYGINSGADTTKVTAKSYRIGGNRLTAYNWENNVSNAGSDWHHTSDMYLVNNVDEKLKTAPGGVALDAAETISESKIPYGLLTLQMLGYVSSEKQGEVSEKNAAPSSWWCKVENRKGSEFSMTPDLTDGVVYTDEYLNYLFKKLGKSDGKKGFKGYALDNEPVLWMHTHSRIQAEPLNCTELIEKSVDLASVVKDMDEGADVFGPALYGYSAFNNFTDTPDWKKIKSDNGYRWFIDYYLDSMKKAEDEQGRRLLDVLDLHFYTEAKGVCGERSCNHYDNDGCIQARLDSVRSLFEEGYRENSWIVDTGAEFFPLLPNVEQSISQYYPGTKLAFTEYNFGGGDHISGAVAQADTLGIFAEHGVYFASIWAFDNCDYQFSAINMFTNYDGKGSGFGDTLVESQSFDRNAVSVYSAIDSKDSGKLRIIAINKSIHDSTPVSISIAGEKEYTSAKVYSLYGDTPEIRRLEDIPQITGNSFEYQLEPLSVTEFEIEIKGGGRQLSTAAVCAGAAVLALLIAAIAVAAVKHRKK